MSNINLGATPPQSTLTVERGGSSLHRPITSVSARVYAKRAAIKAATTIDTSTMRLIPWATVHAKLRRLNPHLLFRPYGDGRIVIGLDRPSPNAIAAYERLSYYERKEIDAPGLRETPGPRVWIIMASSNAIEPYVEIVAADPPHQPVVRSLCTIVRACVQEGAFTWEAAEKMFGMPLRRIPIEQRFMPMTAATWNARNDSAITIASGGVSSDTD